MKKRLWLALLIVMLARLPFLHISFFSVDEAVSAVAANEILEGGLPYKDAIDHRGPLTYFFYAAVFFFLGKGNMWAIHLIYTVIHLAICFLLFQLARKWLPNERQASWAALIYALFSSCFYFTEGLAAHTEWLLSLATVTAWLLYFQKDKSWNLLLAGFFAGLAISSKQVAALDAMAIGLAIWIQRERFKKKIQKSLIYALGVMIVPSSFVLIFYQGNALQDLIFYAFTYNAKFYLPNLSFWTRLVNGAKLLGSFSLNNWLIFPIALLTFKRIFFEKREKGHPHKELILGIWLLFAMMAAMAGGRAYGHYLIPAMLPLSLWSGKILEEYIHTNPWLQSRKIFMVILGLIFIAGPLAWLFIRHKHMLKGDPSISEYKEVSNYLSESTIAGDRIFVWGFAPEIYVLSGTRPASRFTFCNPLTGHLPAANEDSLQTDYAIVAGSWDSLGIDFQKYPPKYIIDTQAAGFKAYSKYSMQEYPFLKEFLAAYQFDSLYLSINSQDSLIIYTLISN